MFILCSCWLAGRRRRDPGRLDLGIQAPGLKTNVAYTLTVIRGVVGVVLGVVSPRRLARGRGRRLREPRALRRRPGHGKARLDADDNFICALFWRLRGRENLWWRCGVNRRSLDKQRQARAPRFQRR